MDKLETLRQNQIRLYEEIVVLQKKAVEHEQWMQRLDGKMDYLSGAIGEIYEAVLKKQLVKQPENNTHQK